MKNVKYVVLGLLLVGLSINMLTPVEAGQTLSVSSPSQTYDIGVGETITLDIQGKDSKRTYDIENPVIVGQQKKGYAMVSNKKIKFTEVGTYMFDIMFENQKTTICVNVSKSKGDGNYIIKAIDGVYTGMVVIKDEEGNYFEKEFSKSGFELPADCDVYLLKNKDGKKLITQLISISESKPESSCDYVSSISGNEINLLATLDELD